MTNYTTFSDSELTEALNFHRRQRNMSRGINEAAHARQTLMVRMLEAEEARRLNEEKPNKYVIYKHKDKYGVSQDIGTGYNWDHSYHHGYHDTVDAAKAWAAKHAGKYPHNVTVKEEVELDEQIKGWKHAASDISKMRAAQGKNVKLVSLKKDGTESKMNDATKMFRSEDEAQEHHDRVTKLNPKSKIRHNLYVDGKHVKTLGEEVELDEEFGDYSSKKTSEKKSTIAHPDGKPVHHILHKGEVVGTIEPYSAYREKRKPGSRIVSSRTNVTKYSVHFHAGKGPTKSADMPLYHKLDHTNVQSALKSAAEVHSDWLKKSALKEEVEQIDEISKSTLGSYATKAMNHADIAARMSHSDSDEMGKIANKRTTGVKKAVDRLAGKKTAASIKSNIDKAREAARNRGTDKGDHGKAYYAAQKGISKIREEAVLDEGYNDPEYIRRAIPALRNAVDFHKELSHEHDKKSTSGSPEYVRAHSAAAKAHREAAERHKIAHAQLSHGSKDVEYYVKPARELGAYAEKLSAKANALKEEVDQIDEISKDTLHSYWKKAAVARAPLDAKARKADTQKINRIRSGKPLTGYKPKDELTPDEKRVRTNRSKGMDRAARTLFRSEEVEINEASLLGPEGAIHKQASADQSDREYLKQMAFKNAWKAKNPGKTWPGYEKAGFKEEVEQIDEISTELKKRYVEKGAQDVIDRFTSRGKYDVPRNPAHFTKTGRVKKSALNRPEAIKYREKLNNRRDIVNKVSQEVHGKKRFGEEVEINEAADLRITKIYNKWPKKATYAVHTPDRKYFKEFDSMEAAKAHHDEKTNNK